MKIKSGLIPTCLLLAMAFLFSCQKNSELTTIPTAPTVDAGPKQSVQLPQTTFNLTGSASSVNGAIRAWQWSLVSGPNLPVISSPGSPTTAVSGFIKGNYIFQLTATDALGYTGVDTTLVQVLNDYIVFTLFPPVVDAGPSQTVQLPAPGGFTLTGTATSTNGSIRAWLWSLVSGPNVPVVSSPGSRITNVSGIIPGRYVFQLMATDSAGLTGVDTTGVTVLPSPVQTLTLQPGNNNANELNFAGNSTSNGSAHDIDLDAGAWTIGGIPWFLRGAFRFNLSSIPSGATIITARLSLYSNPTPINGNLTDANSGPANGFYIRRITAAWDGNTATWQTQPSTTATDQVVIPHTTQSALDLIDIDVKTLVDAMRTSGNYGFMMILQNEAIYNIRQFCSSNHPQSPKWPKLVITYQ